MSYQKIPFFLFIFIMNLTHHIIAIETVEKSIEQNLVILKALIIETAKELSIAEEQKNTDQKKYEAYMAQQEIEKSQRWFYTPDYSAPEIRAYKGTFRPLFGFPLYDNDGSEGKYDTLLKNLEKNETTYFRFKNRLELGKAEKNQEYLEIINSKLQQELKENQK